MDPSNGTSREYMIDPDQDDGIRPVSAEADAGAPDTTDTGPNTAAPVTGQGVVEPPSAPASGSVDGAPSTASRSDRAPRLTRASATWAALVAALLLAVVLIVFVLQNSTPVVIHFLGWSGSLAVGMAMFVAAVTGGLLVATVGVARMTQLRVRERRSRALQH